MLLDLSVVFEVIKLLLKIKNGGAVCGNTCLNFSQTEAHSVLGLVLYSYTS